MLRRALAPGGRPVLSATSVTRVRRPARQACPQGANRVCQCAMRQLGSALLSPRQARFDSLSVRRCCSLPMSQNLSRFFFGVPFGPAVLLLHECGHYFASVALGLTAHFHFAEVTTTYPLPVSSRAMQLVTAAGPAAEALLAIGGFFWLWRLRRSRLQATATRWDWLATFLVLCAGRWLRGLVRLEESDEAFLSASFAFPEWLFPYLLALAALALLIAAVRLHPRGNRLAPFGSAVLGAGLGVILWLKVFGPRILP